MWSRGPFLARCPTLRRSLLGLGVVDGASLAALLGPARLVAKKSRGGCFSYSEDDADAARRDVGAEKLRSEFEALDAAAFVAACAAQPTSDARYYYTAPLLVDQAGWWDAFAPPTWPRRAALWAGGAGSTTQAHYDVADNVLGQRYGRKRVRCWPPSAHSALHVFPDAHPRARKAQALLNRAPAQGERFPLLASLGRPSVDVVLGPGDALAIPAFHFHHCEALDLSLSVNAFFPSAAAEKAAAVLATAMPGGGAPLRFCLDREGLGPPDLGGRLHASRYAPLAASYAALDFAPPLTRPPPRTGDAALERSDCVGALREAAGADHGDGVAEIALAHLLELWGMGLVGDAAALGPRLLVRD